MDFGNEAERQEWIARSSARDRCFMAHRAAVRVFPVLSQAPSEAFDDVVLAAFSALAVTGLSGANYDLKVHTEEIFGLCSSQRTHFTSSSALKIQAAAFGFSSIKHAVRAAYDDDSATRVFTSGATAVGLLADAAELDDTARNIARSSAYKAAAWDTENALGIDTLVPAWKPGKVPPATHANHLNLLKKFRQHAGWDFLAEFYLDLWEGRQPNWAALSFVANEGVGVWSKGLPHAAQIITQNEARARVARALDDIQKEQETVGKNRHGIGGNAPPEPIEDSEDLNKGASIVWAGVGALEKEVEAEKPSTVEIKGAIKLLTEGLGSCVAWLGSKADLATDETIKALTKWGAPLGGAYLLANPTKLQNLIDAAKDWLSLL